jgi:deoxyribose-phosphate aldolase
MSKKTKEEEVAQFIDHTLLRPDAAEWEVRKLCGEAKHYGFAAVCVYPVWVRLCKNVLTGTDVKVCAVVGFPAGAHLREVVACETRLAVRDGADEIDMVINVSLLKDGLDHVVADDVRAVVATAKRRPVKVIIETALLTQDEKRKACLLAKRAGAAFVKTSTGFAKGGATAEDVSLMRETVGPQMGVKASGGIRDFQTAVAMLRAGATRLGCSASVDIVDSSNRWANAGWH